MNYKTGDKVHKVNDTGICTVLEVRTAMAIVEDEHGFKWQVPVAELLPVSGKEYLRKAVEAEGKIIIKEGDIRKSEPFELKRRAQTKIPAVIEVDLHIHELTESNRNLSNYEMLKIQMSHFKSAIENARKERASKLIVIHGVGKGVLKAEIRKALRQTEKCTYEDANYLKYGYGATEVTFW